VPDKPARLFDRDREWTALRRFSAWAPGHPTLGVVSGRRRQGKTFLLDAFTQAVGGFYFVATESTEVEALRQFGQALGEYLGVGEELRFRDWEEAITGVFRLCADQLVVIDEFPYLVKASPVLPSLLQRELDPPAQRTRGSQTNLILCGSAMSVMGGLLSGQAPLRGRASMELMVKPLPYRMAAEFWGITDPRLAVLVHAIVGGTPAYRTQFVRGDAPEGIDDFDDWVIRAVLDQESLLFREARYLLAEEADVRDPGLYHSVLAAIATGNNSRGGIANYMERKSTDLSHPLTVLEDCALISRQADAFRDGRFLYTIEEPLVRFYEAVMRRSSTALERGLAAQVWRSSQARFLGQVVGPHFEALCRDYAIDAAMAMFGELSCEVRAGTVADPANRTQIEVDVVVFGMSEPGSKKRIISLGEVKWGEVMTPAHLARLARARDLLAVKGYDVSDCVLACYGGAGFAAELATLQGQGRVALISLSDLYTSPAV
jgi:AAA+ ATPase superfamily predicted ATPase